LPAPAATWEATLLVLEEVLSVATARHCGAPHYFASFFSGVDIRGKRVLDIGGGDGLFSFYAAACGAASVVCLEPLGDGASPDAIDAFRHLAGSLRRQTVTLDQRTLQEFETPTPFDVVLLHHTINHLNEEATQVLHSNNEARQTYIELFRCIRGLTRCGGVLLAADVARRNLFGDLRLRNPFAPSIEWNKHQSPALWSELLNRAGFSHVHVSWTAPSRLKGRADRLMANGAAAYVLTSHFSLHALALDSRETLDARP
jgi:SAM-dependent methyltransferase